MHLKNRHTIFLTFLKKIFWKLYVRDQNIHVFKAAHAKTAFYSDFTGIQKKNHLFGPADGSLF